MAQTSASASQRREHLLALYELFPFRDHPLWRAIREQRLSLDQLLRAEIQHYLRTKAGRSLREQAVYAAKAISTRLWEAVLETYLEECDSTQAGPSHLELIERLLLHAGVTKSELAAATATPGNAAAIALYSDISRRGAGCHIVGAGMVEYFYSELCGDIFVSYVEGYGMTEHQAETYKLHSSMDKEHAERAFLVIEEAVKAHGWNLVEQSVRDAFVATSLHYDGMLQAATGENSFWDGRRE